MPITKSELVKQLSKTYPNLLKKDLEKFFDIFIEEVKLALKNKLKELKQNKTEEKALAKLTDIKFKDTCDIIFSEIIRVATNKKQKSTEITDFFKVVRTKKK